MQGRESVMKVAAWTLAAAVAASVAVVAVWCGGLNQDEGWYLYSARLVAEGKVPYRDFFFTQGPVLPFVYSALPIHGLLSGRIATLAFSLLSIAAAVAFARGLVGKGRRGAVSLLVFALLACNLYHMYFTSIPKTYAIGSLFVMVGFLFLSRGMNFLSAMSFAFASGTRISLVLILGVVGAGLLVTRFRSLHWLWFGLGGAIGLFLVYGFFAMDPHSLKGLLAAQAYHAARGGFDPFFALGAVSRLARGHLALGAVMFVAIALRGCGKGLDGDFPPDARRMAWIAALGFAAVFLLQLSAPFPYDDYQTPLMPILVVLISVAYANRTASCGPAMRYCLPVLVSGMCAFASPLLQEWMTNGQDRFWTVRKESSELAQMREVARRLESLDPGGDMLLTQDLYLAVEMGRKVPEGLEMGPFSYFPDLPSAEAKALHVINREGMRGLFDSAPCRLAAFSGYGLAIEAPKGTMSDGDDVEDMFEVLERRYRKAGEVPLFGQNHTTLRYFIRK